MTQRHVRLVEVVAFASCLAWAATASAQSNTPPVVSFTWHHAAAAYIVQFADASTDAEGSIYSREWDFGDGTTSIFQNPNHEFPGRGNYTVRLTVWDQDGANATATRVVEVRDPTPSTDGAADPQGPHRPPGAPPLPVPIEIALPAAVAPVAIGAAVAVHEPSRWRLLLGLAPLYTRLARSQILESGLREAIYGYIEENPGTHLRKIQRDLRLHNGSILYHLQVLERERYVRTVRDGMWKRYYVVGTAPPPAGAEPLQERIAAHLETHPGRTNAQIAQELGKRPSLVHYHVERLVEAGRVRKEREGKEVRLFFVVERNSS